MIFCSIYHLQCHCSGPFRFPRGWCSNFSSAPSLSSQLQPSYPKHKYNNVLLLLESCNDYQLCLTKCSNVSKQSIYTSHSTNTNLYTFPWGMQYWYHSAFASAFSMPQENSSSLFLFLPFQVLLLCQHSSTVTLITQHSLPQLSFWSLRLIPWNQKLYVFPLHIPEI